MQVWINKENGGLIIRIGNVDGRGQIEDMTDNEQFELFCENGSPNDRYVMSRNDLFRDYERLYSLDMITKKFTTRNVSYNARIT